MGDWIGSVVATPRPMPLESPLLGFLERVPAGARYAICPLGRYTRACVEDVPAAALEAEGRRLLGFVDDGGREREWYDRPVAPLRDAAGWPLDALLLLRDTADRRLARRVECMRGEGLLRGVRIIDQPSPTFDAMLAHQATYEPGTEYSPEFLRSCRSQALTPWAGSTLMLTLDAEMFAYADRDAAWLYPAVMREFTRIVLDAGFSFTLCVQLRDTPGGMLRTPPTVIEDALHALGPEAIALHGWDHAMPSDGYEREWLARGIEELRGRYGVEVEYWAPPGWSLNWRTLRVLEETPIRWVRGIRTGVNVRRGDVVETVRFPYRVGAVWQIPYAYADWMFATADGKRLDDAAIVPWHERLAEFAARGPCRIESVAHPFRLVGRDWRDRLAIVRRSLACYTRRGVTLQAVAQAQTAVGGVCA